MGWPTVKAIYGQELVPGYADRYLAENAYEGQETSQPVAADRPDNLFEPATGDYAAHGIFNKRASAFSLQSWVNIHRGPAAMIAGGLAALACATLSWKGRQ